MASFRRVLYVGVTNNLSLRVWQHKTGRADSFTAKYKVNRLVYAESTGYVEDAIAREKQIKKWRREKKERLIFELNPEWKDLADEWGLVEGMKGQ
jgi:putative endonuclease